MSVAMADRSAASTWQLLTPASTVIAERVAESPRATDPRLLSRRRRIMERGSDPPPLAADVDADAAATISGVASEAFPASSACTPTSRSGASGPVRSARRRIPAPTSPPSAASSVSPMSPVSMVRGAWSASASAPRGGGASPPFVDGSVPAIHGASEGSIVAVRKDALSHCAPSDSAVNMMPPCTRRSPQPAAAAQISSASASASGSSGEARRRAGSHRRSLSCPDHDALMADALQPLPAPGARMARCSGSSNNLALIAAATAPTPATPSPNRHRVLFAASAAGGRSAGSPPSDSPPRATATTPVNRRGGTRPRGLDSSASFPASCPSPVFTSCAPSVSATPPSPVACPTTPSGLPPRSRKPAASHSSAYPQVSPRPASLDEPAMFASDGDRLRATSPTLVRVEPPSQSTAAQIMASSPWAREESPRLTVVRARQGGFSPAVSPNALSPTAFAFPLQSDSIPSPHSVPVLNLPSETVRTGKACTNSLTARGVISNGVGGDARLVPVAHDDGSDSDDDFVGLYQTVAQRRAMVSAAHHMHATAGLAKPAPTQAHSAAASGRGGGVHGAPGVVSGAGDGNGRQVQGRSRRSMSADLNFSSWAMEMYDTAKSSRGAERRDARKGAVAPLDAEEFRAHAHRMVDYIADYYRDIESHPVRSTVEVKRSYMSVCLPLLPLILPSPCLPPLIPSPHALPSLHPRPLERGTSHSPRPPSSFPSPARGRGGGVIQGTASEAVLVAVLAAREKALRALHAQHQQQHAQAHAAAGAGARGAVGEGGGGEGAVVGSGGGLERLVAYVSDQTHSCVKKACQIAGLPSSNLRVLATSASDNYALQPSTLQAAVDADTRAGLLPFFLTCTVGTTSSTAVDPIEPLAAIAQAHGMWVHVDAAYGGAACVCEEHRQHLAGVQHVQSLAINAHKWLLTNFDCCCLWTQDTKAVQDALTTTPEYLRNKVSAWELSALTSLPLPPVSTLLSVPSSSPCPRARLYIPIHLPTLFSHPAITPHLPPCASPLLPPVRCTLVRSCVDVWVGAGARASRHRTASGWWTTRTGRALKLWFVLRMFGAAQLRAYIRHHVSLARWFEAAVAADARFQPAYALTTLLCTLHTSYPTRPLMPLPQPPLSPHHPSAPPTHHDPPSVRPPPQLMAPRTFALVCFRLRPPGQAEQHMEGHGGGEQGGGARGGGGDEGWALNEALLEAVNSSGKAFLTHTVSRVATICRLPPTSRSSEFALTSFTALHLSPPHTSPIIPTLPRAPRGTPHSLTATTFLPSRSSSTLAVPPAVLRYSHIAMACCSLQLAAPTAAWKGQAQSLTAAGDRSSFFGRLPAVARSPLVADVAASRPAASTRVSAAPRASSGLIGVSGDVVSPRAARQKIPPMQPVVLTPSGPADLMSAFLRNRIIFVGSAINQQMAQRVIQQLLALSAVDDRQDIKVRAAGRQAAGGGGMRRGQGMYINCPGGSTYSVLAIYDCMAWIKPDVQTVAFGMTASQGALLLAAGAKGKRLAMPNSRIMIHQPQGGCGGSSEDVRRQVNEVMASRDVTPTHPTSLPSSSPLSSHLRSSSALWLHAPSHNRRASASHSAVPYHAMHQCQPSPFCTHVHGTCAIPSNVPFVGVPFAWPRPCCSFCRLTLLSPIRVLLCVSGRVCSFLTVSLNACLRGHGCKKEKVDIG
ncbi:unnamed protein product, partial [Closterium sp. Naga37s-1]